jgi:hypothetical protein
LFGRYYYQELGKTACAPLNNKREGICQMSLNIRLRKDFEGITQAFKCLEGKRHEYPRYTPTKERIPSDLEESQSLYQPISRY